MKNVLHRMAKGAAWLVLFRMTERVIGLVSTLILARLLIPADFGLIAMAMSILALLEMMSAFSFDTALIQNQNAQRRHYDTAWTFNVLFGLTNAAALIALAVPAAAFFGEPRVTGIMFALAAICAVKGFGNIGCVAFQKDLDLHKEFLLGVTRKLVGFTVTIALALSLRSYWALIAGTFASAVTGVALTYRMHPYRPRFSMAGHKELLHFSKWMLVNNLLISLMHRVPDLVVGKVAGPAALGLYTVAYEISNLPTTELVWPISRAVFPGYSKMAKGEELRRGFLDVLAVILLVTMPAGLGIVVLAEPFVHVLLGPKWTEAIPLIQVLAVYGILRASASNTGSALLALGLPRILTYFTLLNLVVLFPSLYWLVREHGAYGAALSVLLTGTIVIPIAFAVSMRRMGLGVAALAAVVWRPVTAGLIMTGAVVAVRSSWISAEAGHLPAYLLQLAALVPFGAGIYVATVLGLWIISGRPNGGESKLLTVAGLAFDKLSRWGAKSA